MLQAGVIFSRASHLIDNVGWLLVEVFWLLVSCGTMCRQVLLIIVVFFLRFFQVICVFSVKL